MTPILRSCTCINAYQEALYGGSLRRMISTQSGLLRCSACRTEYATATGPPPKLKRPKLAYTSQKAKAKLPYTPPYSDDGHHGTSSFKHTSRRPPRLWNPPKEP